MSSLRFESPMKWPAWIPATARASQRSDHGFPSALKITEAIDYLEQELQQLHCNGTLSLDIEQPNIERLRKKVGSRTGACLQLNYHGRNYVIACDRWLTIDANIYAVHLAVRQWRNMERWGIGNIPTLLRGFEPGQAVEADTSFNTPVKNWMQALGLGPTATLEDAVAVYHRRAKLVAHDDDALTQLNLMMDQARQYFDSEN